MGIDMDEDIIVMNSSGSSELLNLIRCWLLVDDEELKKALHSIIVMETNILALDTLNTHTAVMANHRKNKPDLNIVPINRDPENA